MPYQGEPDRKTQFEKGLWTVGAQTPIQPGQDHDTHCPYSQGDHESKRYARHTWSFKGGAFAGSGKVNFRVLKSLSGNLGKGIPRSALVGRGSGKVARLSLGQQGVCAYTRGDPAAACQTLNWQYKGFRKEGMGAISTRQ